MTEGVFVKGLGRHVVVSALHHVRAFLAGSHRGFVRLGNAEVADNGAVVLVDEDVVNICQA